MRKEVLRMERVTYEEQGVKKLDYLNLQILTGEILGLLPINASGLPALIELLKANLPLEDGYIYYNERLLNSWKDSNKETNPITVIGDASCLVGDLTVYDNIFVLRKNFRRPLISPTKLMRQLDPFFEEIQLFIPAGAYVDKLSSFERVVVEILKGIVSGHKLIVLDEIQNLLTDAEREKLLQIMDIYTKKGVSFLYISVHFEDILHRCNRGVFFQNGRIVKTLQPDQLTMNSLIVNTEAYQTIVKRYMQTREPPQGATQFTLDYRFQSANTQLHLATKQAECVALQCLDNEMYHEMLHSLLNQYLPLGSHMQLGSKSIRTYTRDLAVINESPAKTMLLTKLTCLDNLCFNMDGRIKDIWLHDNIRRSVQAEYQEDFGDIFNTSVDALTEKQKYKLVYTRILLQRPKVVFCIQPFKGADLGLRMYIFTLLETLLRNGITLVILFINLADTLSIADRLILLERNTPQTEYQRNQFKHIKSVAPWKNMKDNKGDLL